jgi:hypothetical protein
VIWWKRKKGRGREVVVREIGGMTSALYSLLLYTHSLYSLLYLFLYILPRMLHSKPP